MRSDFRHGLPARAWSWVRTGLLPTAVATRWLAFAVPDVTERWYSQGLYPVLAGALAALSRRIPVSVAEVAALAALGAALVLCVRAWRRRRDRLEALRAPLAQRVRYGAATLWLIAGIGAWVFLLSWGFNYARVPLRERMQLDTTAIDAAEVLELGRAAATAASDIYIELGFDPREPTALPMSFAELSAIVEARLEALELPGDRVRSMATAKRLWGSSLMSYLGISGIFIPLTGEPSVNGLVPDASMPVVVAHEMAHRHGVTDEGEANMVGLMVGVGAEEPYLRYAAYLDAAARLLGAAGRYLPQEADAAWESMGAGPRRDLHAIREFWRSYQGPAVDVARRVNDAYLRSNRVPGGAQSYGRVVPLLVGLQRQGRFLPQSER